MSTTEEANAPTAPTPEIATAAATAAVMKKVSGIEQWILALPRDPIKGVEKKFPQEMKMKMKIDVISFSDISYCINCE